MSRAQSALIHALIAALLLAAIFAVGMSIGRALIKQSSPAGNWRPIVAASFRDC
jgi:hypothetical protein